MRQDRTLRRDVRGNALWGRRGESRSNALWGSGKRGIVLTALAAMLVVPVAGSAALGVPSSSAVVPKSLLAQATANPAQQFNVIVQGDKDSTDMSILQNSFDPNTGAITGPAPQAPTIAVVDSGVQARSDFGNRLVAQVDMCSLCTSGG